MLSRRYDDLIPLVALRAGFEFAGHRLSYGSFFNGIYRPREMRGPGALSLLTAAPKVGRDAPYEDGFDEAAGTFTYRYRDAGKPSRAAEQAAEADNRALVGAFETTAPVIYFRGIAAGQYAAIAPMFVTRNDPAARMVHLEAALPLADLTDRGLVSTPDIRRYATQEVRVRLHQQRFRLDVLRAYRQRCGVCSLRELALVQAAHIIEDRTEGGEATVANGIALCAIHHLAYDRNLMGIDPAGVVHIAHRLLNEVDGPMLRAGLQGFHGAKLLRPRRTQDRPDPERLEVRYEAFQDAAA